VIFACLRESAADRLSANARERARKRECWKGRKQDSLGENALARALLLSFPGACWACTRQCPHVSNIIQQLGHLNLCIVICRVLLFNLWLLLCEPCTKTYIRKSQLAAKCTTSLSLSLFLSLSVSFSVSLSLSLFLLLSVCLPRAILRALQSKGAETPGKIEPTSELELTQLDFQLRLFLCCFPRVSTR